MKLSMYIKIDELGLASLVLESHNDNDGVKCKMTIKESVEIDTQLQYVNAFLILSDCEKLKMKDTETLLTVVDCLLEKPCVKDAEKGAYRSLEITGGKYISETKPRWIVGKEGSAAQPAFVSFESFAQDYVSLKKFEEKMDTEAGLKQ